MFDSSKILKDLENQLMTKKWIKEEAAKAKTGGIKIVPEQEQRARLINLARMQGHGVEIELQKLFDKYDNLLKNCTNKKEKAHIAYMGVTECHALLNCSDSVIINGYIVAGGQETDYDVANKKV